MLVLVASAPAAAHEAEFKSPGPGMHFTEGLPIIVFADIADARDYHGFIIDGVGWPQFQVLVDGVKQIDGVTGKDTVPGANMVDQNGNPSPADFYRFSVTGLAPGGHQVVARGLFFAPGDSDVAVQDSAPITIIVDPRPDKTVVNLTGDVSGPVNWDNVIVVGNGHKVNASGSLVIADSLVSGLGSLDTAGISGSLDSVDIQGSIFEAMGSLDLTIGGSAVIRGNEFRANNLIKFIANDPDASPVILLTGNSTEPKLFQGNRIGAGRVVFDSTRNWLVGGDSEADSNILIGPRCTLYFQNGSSDITVRGNYDHHNYRGGWSQGFNLSFQCQQCRPADGSGILVEHNFFTGGSWPIQNLIGEFRYNVVYGYGHAWIRSAVTGALIHHNVFTPDGIKGSLDRALDFYRDETGLNIYNNTFDGGGPIGDMAGPTVAIGGTTQVLSLRNNLFTFSRNQGNDNPGDARVVGGALVSADYNAFYSPDNDNNDSYAVAGMTEGSTPGFAAHDVSGNGDIGVVDGELAEFPFAGERIYPLNDGTVVDEAAIWQGTQKVSYVLAAFRSRYTPKPGSPLSDAGDPQDNDSQDRRADIGAVDLGGHDQDKFGKFGTPPSEFEAPTVSLTSPEANATVTGTITLEATAQDNEGGSGVVLVQFLVDGSVVAQTATSPYSASFNTAIVANADHVFSAKAWDAAGNFAFSEPVPVTVAGNVGPPGGGGGPGGDGGNGGSGGSNASGGCQVMRGTGDGPWAPGFLSILGAVAAAWTIRRPRDRRTSRMSGAGGAAMRGRRRRRPA